MNKLILCEGKTDAILLSYYLESTCGWTHRNVPKSLAIRADEVKGESAYWYRKNDESLLICGVGGKNNFGSFFKEKILPTLVNSGSFSKIAVVTDRDDQEEQSILDSFRSIFRPIITNVEIDIWVTNSYENSYKQESVVDFLLVIIPADKEGALESLLLDAISENEYDKTIVKRSIAYVNEIQPLAEEYIHKNRLKLKACLGGYLGNTVPRKDFLIY